MRSGNLYTHFFDDGRDWSTGRTKASNREVCNRCMKGHVMAEEHGTDRAQVQDLLVVKLPCELWLHELPYCERERTEEGLRGRAVRTEITEEKETITLSYMSLSMWLN